MKILRSTLAAMAFFLVCTQACFAAPIFYERADLGAGRYELSYTVDNQTSFAITEFTIWFDLGLYDNLAITSSPVDWDGLAAQPDPGLPDDGFADWLSLGLAIAPGVSLGGFSVAFDWLGTGLPGAQFFEIVDPDTFIVLESGFTQPLLPVAAVPEPPALVLLALGLLLLIGSIDRRVKRRVKKTGKNRVSLAIFAGVYVTVAGLRRWGRNRRADGNRPGAAVKRTRRAGVL